MARGQKNAGLLEAVAVLPWWVGLLLALLSWLICSALAARPIVAGDVFGAMLKGLGTGGRIALPILFVAAAAASALKQAHRRSLFAAATGANGREAVENMDWRSFEALLSEAFRLQGYRVTETGGGGADGGIDLALWRDSELTLVQCKHWKAFKVSVSVVRELAGVLTARRAQKGIVVTSGRFTGDAHEFARSVSITLVDGPRLEELLARAKASATPSKAMRDGHTARPAPRPVVVDSMPACPACGAVMAKRIAGKGAKVGQSFWGCSTFPKCRGTRPM